MSHQKTALSRTSSIYLNCKRLSLQLAQRKSEFSAPTKIINQCESSANALSRTCSINLSSGLPASVCSCSSFNVCKSESFQLPSLALDHQRRCESSASANWGILNFGNLFNVSLLIISYCHSVSQKLSFNSFGIMSPSTLGPAIQAKDTLTRRNEIVLIKLPVEMSLGDTTKPSTWSGGQGLGYVHPCIILSMEYIGETSKVRI